MAKNEAPPQNDNIASIGNPIPTKVNLDRWKLSDFDSGSPIESFGEQMDQLIEGFDGTLPLRSEVI